VLHSDYWEFLNISNLNGTILTPVITKIPNGFELDTFDLPEGVYVITLQSSTGNTEVVKWIKQKP
jgi:hypothetical protein